jgi:hypothetical protein
MATGSETISNSIMGAHFYRIVMIVTWSYDLRPILNLTPRGKLWPQDKFSPRGKFFPRGNFSPRGKFCPLGWSYPLGVKFSVRPSILQNIRECSPLGVNKGVNIPPRVQISPLGAKFNPRGEVIPWGQRVKLRLALCALSQVWQDCKSETDGIIVSSGNSQPSAVRKGGDCRYL